MLVGGGADVFLDHFEDPLAPVGLGEVEWI